MGPNYVAPRVAVPAQFTERGATGAEVVATRRELVGWWRRFGDRVLDRLVAEAVAGNVGLRVADQRLLQARAERDEVAAGAYPQVNFSTQVQRAYSSPTLEYPPGIGNYHDYILGFDATWELDIFGKNRRATEAADARIGATIAARRGLLVSLTSEVASDYATLRADQALLSIARDDVRIARAVLGVAQREFAMGIGTDLQTAQARAQLDQTEAAVPRLQAGIAVLAHAIAVLTGRAPGALEAMLDRPMPLMGLPATLPATVPAAVIAYRPDVAEAAFRYRAANAEIGVAVADRLPDFSIPLSIMPEASAISQLFSAATLAFSYGLNSATPVYTGGKLTARVRAARAVAAQARLNYRQTVLSALQNVEDGLIRVETDRRAGVALAAGLRDSETALDRARRLNAAGLTGFLTVLTAERTVFAARDALATNRLSLVQDYIALFKALGGSPESNDDTSKPIRAKVSEGADGIPPLVNSSAR